MRSVKRRLKRTVALRNKTKPAGKFGVILLSEYHASSIRLWRVVLLRSGIRLSPSDIRYASFMANRISL